jgi:hypothetical protein
MFHPSAFALVLLLQFIYKGTWLLAVALPAWLQGKPFPGGMAAFFVAWVLVLPWFIPWRSYFA